MNKAKKLDDILIDNCLSSIDAALILKPYIEAEEKNIEKTLTNVLKVILYFYFVNVLKLLFNMLPVDILMPIVKIYYFSMVPILSFYFFKRQYF